MHCLLRPWPLLPAAILCLLTACGGGKESPDPGAAAPASPAAPAAPGAPATTPSERLSIGVIPKGTIHEFWLAVQSGAEAAGRDADVEIRWDGPKTETAHDEQRRILESMVGAGVDGIVIAPTDQVALRRPVEAAVKAGVPVVVFDSNLEGDAHLSFVATDNRRGGALAGEALATRCAATPRRMLLLRYTEGSGSTRLREAGFEEAAKAGGGTVVESQFTDGTTEGAITTATNMLQRHVRDGRLEVDGIFACNQPTTIGMFRALDRLRKQGIKVDALLIGFDSSDELVKGVEEGTIAGLVVQDPVRMGNLAVKTMVDHLRGKPVEKSVDTGVTLVTRENLGDPQVARLVGRGG